MSKHGTNCWTPQGDSSYSHVAHKFVRSTSNLERSVAVQEIGVSLTNAVALDWTTPAGCIGDLGDEKLSPTMLKVLSSLKACRSGDLR